MFRPTACVWSRRLGCRTRRRYLRRDAFADLLRSGGFGGLGPRGDGAGARSDRDGGLRHLGERPDDDASGPLDRRPGGERAGIRGPCLERGSNAHGPRALKDDVEPPASRRTRSRSRGRRASFTPRRRWASGRAAAYEIRVPSDERPRKFRTVDDDPAVPTRFVLTSDIYRRRDAMTSMHGHVAARDPAFAVFAGDIAYANGELENAGRWLDFLARWDRYVVTEGGFSVPTIGVIGNHEVSVGYGGSPSDAPFFPVFYPFPGGAAVRGAGLRGRPLPRAARHRPPDAHRRGADPLARRDPRRPAGPHAPLHGLARPGLPVLAPPGFFEKRAGPERVRPPARSLRRGRQLRGPRPRVQADAAAEEQPRRPDGHGLHR